MNIDDLTIGQARAIASMLGNSPAPASPAPTARRPVIVRSRDAGVQFGYLEGYEGSTVHLTNARQMWSWTAKAGGTLLDCATVGVKGGKFSSVASAVTVIGACAIIDCSPEAVKTLEDAKWG